MAARRPGRAMVKTTAKPDRHMWRGTYTALVTPFAGGEIDWRTVKTLLDRQIEAGVVGVVPCGSTGESATLTHDEHQRVIEAVVRHVDGRCRVLAGTGSNSTAEAIAMSRQAADVGADGVMLVAPYYVRPSQEGLYRHYAAVAQAVDLPIVLYNVPSRCGVDLANDTVVRLSRDFKNIVALKDASGGVDRVSSIAERGEVAVLCGDDSLTLPMMALGAVGVISVIANLVPSWMTQLVEARDREAGPQPGADQDGDVRPRHARRFVPPSPVPHERGESPDCRVAAAGVRGALGSRTAWT